VLFKTLSLQISVFIVIVLHGFYFGNNLETKRGQRVKMNFGDDFRRAREEHGWNVAEVAELLGLTGNAVHKWESGENFPTVKRWRSIKEHLQIDPAEYKYEERAPSISATVPDATIPAGQMQPTGKHQVALTESEYIVLVKFRRIGSPAILLEKCLQKMSAIEAIIG